MGVGGFMFFRVCLIVLFLSTSVFSLEDILEQNLDVVDCSFIEFFEFDDEHGQLATLRSTCETRIAASTKKNDLKSLLLKKHMNNDFFRYILRDYLRRDLSEARTILMYRVAEESELEDLQASYASRLVRRRTLLRRSNEVPHFENNFEPGDTLLVAGYFSDQIAGDLYNYTIYDPAGNIWQTWNHSSDETYGASYWYWYWWLPMEGPYGEWNFEIEKDGEINSHAFNYGLPTSTENHIETEIISIYPNPITDKIYFKKKLEPNSKITIYNHSGQLLLKKEIKSKIIDVSTLPAGLLYLKIETKNDSVIKKLLKI